MSTSEEKTVEKSYSSLFAGCNKAQSEAMAKANLSLRAATENAVKANKGFCAVRVTPSLKNGHPVAGITLVKGEEFKTAKLD
jgi:hypothetical protein